MIMPNTILIGAAKSGTTSLYHYLREHPEVFVTKREKETNHFTLNYKNTEHATAWRADFASEAARAATVRLDLANTYLFEPEATARIFEDCGADTKILAILRNPAEGAYSLWKHMVYKQREGMSFAEALRHEERRRDVEEEGFWTPNLLYRARYTYTPQLRRYYNLFPAENIKIFAYEEFFDDVEASWRELCEFLNINASFIPASLNQAFNQGTTAPRSQLLYDIVFSKKKIKKHLVKLLPRSLKQELRRRLDDFNRRRPNVETPSIPEGDAAAIAQLRRDCEPDIISLEELTGKSFNCWR